MDSTEQEVPEDVPNPVDAEGSGDGQGGDLGGDGGDATDIEAQPTSATSEGRARDPLTGKFIPKASASGDTAEDLAGEAEAPAAEGVGEVAEAPPAPQASVTRPFAVKAQGQFHELSGAQLRADGSLEASPEAVEFIHTYMGRGIKYEVEVPRLKAQIAHLTQERTEQEEYNRLVGEEYAALAQLPDDQLVEAIQEFRQRYPVLREQVRRERVERELEAIRRGQIPDQRQVRQQREQQFYATFDSVWAEETQKAQGVLNADELKDLREELRGISDSFLIVADRDNEDEGWKRGDWVFNDQRMSDLIARRVTQIRRYKAQLVADAKAKAANAAILNPVKPKAPPLAANAPINGAGETGEKKFKSRDDWRASMFAR